MKITMYELLGLVKDGKAPKKIKTGNIIYELDNKKEYLIWADEIYHEVNKDYIWLNFKHINSLNDEVEIIEEKEMCHKCHKYPAEYNQTYCEFCLGISKLEEHKIPKKIEICYSPDIEEEIFYEKGNKPNHYVLRDAGTKLIINKINEIIDYLEVNKDE